MDLFQNPTLTKIEDPSPLAARMAPRDWEEFIGQESLIDVGQPLRRAIEIDRLTSSIFFGPPGTGKTALARMAAKKSNSAIEYINAVTAGVADIRKVIKKAIDRRLINNQKTILVIDEIHHFNRSQQDALLPDVERGNLTLIGLTTENPYFYVNSALMSRSTAYEFKILNEKSLMKIYNNALKDTERGLGKYHTHISDDAIKHFIRTSNGDARRLLNTLELAVLTTPPNDAGFHIIDLKVAEASAQKRSIQYDKSGDEHYDTISAFIKSMRGSDPDAALYWMAKMIHAGEDPRFIARRIMICASEDVGNADPRAISVATAAANMVDMVGMPEGRIPLSQAAVYVACAPKSNASYLAIDKALAEVQKGPYRAVPNHLKDANADREALGHGKGYQYPHNFKDHHVKQTYMPEWIEFYKPTQQGKEADIKARLDQWRKENPQS